MENLLLGGLGRHAHVLLMRRLLLLLLYGVVELFLSVGRRLVGSLNKFLFFLFIKVLVRFDVLLEGVTVLFGDHVVLDEGFG